MDSPQTECLLHCSNGGRGIETLISFIQCRLQTTLSLCQPRSYRRASLSSQQLRSAGFFCGRPCDMELVTRQYERPGHQQRLLQTFTEDWRRFYFQLTCVHSALELSGWCALQIYLLTFLLTNHTKLFHICSQGYEPHSNVFHHITDFRLTHLSSCQWNFSLLIALLLSPTAIITLQRFICFMTYIWWGILIACAIACTSVHCY